MRLCLAACWRLCLVKVVGSFLVDSTILFYLYFPHLPLQFSVQGTVDAAVKLALSHFRASVFLQLAFANNFSVAASSRCFCNQRPSVRPPRPFVRSSARLSVRPTGCSSVCPVRLSVRPSVRPTIRPLVRPSVRSFRPCVRRSVRPIIRWPVRPCVLPSRPSVRSFARLSVRLSARGFVRASRASIRPSVRPTIRPHVHPLSVRTVRPSVRTLDVSPSA